MTLFKAILATGLLLVLAGCVLSPEGTQRENDKLLITGKALAIEESESAIPDLPSPATWKDVLHRAFLANGDLKSAYFEWKASLKQIPQMAGYPNSNLAPSFSYMFSPGRMKTFDRTTVNVGFDPMQNLAFPTKVVQAGKMALENAHAVSAKFESVKFDLQQKVLSGYLDLALIGEKIRIQQENVSLLKLLTDSAADRVRGGNAQQDLLKAQTNHRLAENELANLQAMQQSMRAMLNGMLAREADAPIALPDELPERRKIPVDDAKLIAVATYNNPELKQLSFQVAGRSEALELARMQFIPDINPFAAFAGGLSQSIGAMVIIPTTIPQIRGRIEESRAMLQSAQAMLKQGRYDKSARFVAALYLLRNSERQEAIFRDTILPRAEQTLASSRQAYSTGTGSFIDLIDSQRTLLDIRILIAETRIEREKRLAELEALAGVDLETLAGPTSMPTSQKMNTE